MTPTEIGLSLLLLVVTGAFVVLAYLNNIVTKSRKKLSAYEEAIQDLKPAVYMRLDEIKEPVYGIRADGSNITKQNMTQFRRDEGPVKSLKSNSYLPVLFFRTVILFRGYTGKTPNTP